MSIYTNTTTVVKRHAGGNLRNQRVVHPKRIERQAGAKVRKEISDKLTPQERLAKLDQSFGKGQGAAKERAKLAKLLQKA